MWILAIDPSEYGMGWIVGQAGTVPPARSLALRRQDQRMEDAVANFAAWIRDRFEEKLPDLLCMPHYVSVAAFSASGWKSRAATIEGQILLHGAARGVCACYGVAFRTPPEATIRKHFCGKSSANPRRPGKISDRQRAENRLATKAMVIRRAQMVGYLSREDYDDDAADAAAVFDFAAAHFARRTQPLTLFAG